MPVHAIAPTAPSGRIRRAALVGSTLALAACGALGCAILRPESPDASRRALHENPFTATAPGAPLPDPKPREKYLAGYRPAPEFPYLVLKLAERRLYLIEGDAGQKKSRRRTESFPVAIGRDEYRTPTGRFQVATMIVDPEFVVFEWKNPSKVLRRIGPGAGNPLGARWIGFTSAYGWEIGFHGTPNPELLGQAVSHGCVRMRNADVVNVFSRVTIGTVVIVQD